MAAVSDAQLGAHLVRTLGQLTAGNVPEVLSALDEATRQVEADAAVQAAMGSKEVVETLVSVLHAVQPPSPDKAGSAGGDAGAGAGAGTVNGSGYMALAVASLSETDQRALVERALWLLVRLCRRTMDKDTACVANAATLEALPGALEACVRGASAHQAAAAGVAAALCWLVMVLACDSEERQYRLTAAGAATAVVAVLTAHTASAEVAELACRAARNLAAGDDDVVAKLVEDGVCPAVVGVLEMHGKHDAHVAVAALWALVNLSCDERVSLILGSVGAVDAVLSLATWASDPRFPLPLLSAIRNLSAAGTLNYSLLARSEVCRVVVTVLEGRVGGEHDPEIAEAALWAMANLACDVGLAKRLVLECGAAELIVATYRAIVPHHPAEGRPAGPISEACLWAITNLAAGGEENEERLGAAGAVAVTAACLRNYQHREGMVEVAAAAMVHLVCHCDTNRRRICRTAPLAATSSSGNGHPPAPTASATATAITAVAGDGAEAVHLDHVFPTLLELVVGTHMTSVDLSEAVVRLLVMCLGCPGAKQLFRDLGADKAVVGAMRNHSDVEEIVRLGCDVLLHVLYDVPAHRERLKEAKQLNTDGSAHPTGTFEAIADAWCFTAIAGAPAANAAAAAAAAAAAGGGGGGGDNTM